VSPSPPLINMSFEPPQGITRQEQEASLASALRMFQEDRCNPDILIASHLSAYGLAMSFAVTETGAFQATLLHEDGGQLVSGLCENPDDARDLVLGVKWLMQR
jgi:hypothetical protein